MIRQIKEDEIHVLNVFGRDAGYFSECFKRKDRDIYVVFDGEQAVGYCLLNYHPRYSLYKRLEMPEIQDVFILPDHREKGLATALINHCETEAAKQNKEYIGVSVALHKALGPAQRLYVKLGYQPDGFGVTYDRQPVDSMKAYKIDDDLCLMMIKAL